MRFRGTSLLLTFAVALLACERGDPGVNVDSLTVTPTGEEHWARLTFRLPAGGCQLGVAAEGCQWYVDGRTFAVDGQRVPIAPLRVRPGRHVISFRGTAQTLTVAADEVRDFPLAAARLRCVELPWPVMPRTDFGATHELTRPPCPGWLRSASPPPVVFFSESATCTIASGHPRSATILDGSDDCAALSDTVWTSAFGAEGRCVRPPTPMSLREACEDYRRDPLQYGRSAASFDGGRSVFLPGDYLAPREGTTDVPVRLIGDAVTDVSIELPVVGALPAVFTTRVSFLDPPALPDAARPTITSSCPTDRRLELVTARGTVELSAFQSPGCDYVLHAGPSAFPLDQAGQNRILLRRLDIADVEVTREDGTTYTTVGRYTIRAADGTTTDEHATPSGIDVLPGTYEIITRFQTGDGEQQHHSTITL